MEEVDQRPAIRPEPDPESSLHTLVVANHQPSQRLRWLPGATRLDGHFHARQNTHAQDLAHSDFPRPLVAEDPRVGCHGSLPGVRSGAGRPGG